MNYIPAITDENFIFNTEGPNAVGWTVSNATLAPAENSLVFTKAVAADAFISKALPQLPVGRDYIVYGKVRAKNAAGCANVIWLRNATATQQVALWLGTDGNSSQTIVPGNIGLAASISGSMHNAPLATGFDYQNNWVEFAVQFDSTFQTATAFFRDPDGLWSFKGRVSAEVFASPCVYVQSSGSSPVGNFVEVQYLSICRPNVIAIGDSVVAGATLYNPNPTFSLTNYLSTWMRYVNLYPELRNNLIVNKGVAGNTTQMILARIGDASNQGARVVFLQGSSNDEAAAVTLDARTSMVQACIAYAASAGAKVILLSGMDGVRTSSFNTDAHNLKGFMQAWWSFYRGKLIGVDCFIEIAAAVRGDDGYQDQLLTQSDGIHPNPAGYQAIAQFVKLSLAA